MPAWLTALVAAGAHSECLCPHRRYINFLCHAACLQGPPGRAGLRSDCWARRAGAGGTLLHRQHVPSDWQRKRVHLEASAHTCHVAQCFECRFAFQIPKKYDVYHNPCPSRRGGGWSRQVIDVLLAQWLLMSVSAMFVNYTVRGNRYNASLYSMLALSMSHLVSNPGRSEHAVDTL